MAATSEGGGRGTEEGARLIAMGLVAMVLVPMLLGVLALTLLRGTVRRDETLVNEYLGNVVRTRELTTYSNKSARKVRDFLLTGDGEHLRVMSEQRTRADELINQMLQDGPPERREMLARIQVVSRDMAEVSDEVIGARQRTGRVVGETERRVRSEMMPLRRRLEAEMDLLLSYDKARYETAQRSSRSAASQAWWLMTSAFVVVAGTCGGLGALLLRQVRERGRTSAERAVLLDRERAARADAERHKRLLDLVIEQSGDGVIVADAEGHLRIFNAEAERQHGVPRQDVDVREWARTYGLTTTGGRPLPPEASPLLRAYLGAFVTGAQWRVRRPDGTVRTLSGTASPLRNPDGSPAGAVLTARDETDRLQLEQQRVEALAQLDALFVGAPVGLGFLDARLRFVRVNSPLAAITGAAPERHLGRSLREMMPQASEQMEPLVTRVLQTGAPQLGQELSQPANDGSTVRRFLLYCFGVDLPQDATAAVGLVVVDVTELKDAEERLRSTVEFRERFLGIVGHDLRNPLNAIGLSARALLLRGVREEREIRAVQRIISSADRMARMIAELLDVTRIRLGDGLPIHTRTIDVCALTRDAIEELEALEPGAKITLTADGDGTGEWDPDRLTQVVSNLVGNALQHGKTAAPVRVRVDGRSEEEVVLSVHNDGEPIPAELLPDLFEPFRRGTAGPKPSHAKDGLGLGLYIVHQIILAHRGTLRAESSVDAGTIIVARLPRRRQADPMGPVRAGSAGAQKPFAATGHQAS